MMVNSIREEKEVKKVLSKFLFIAAFVVLIFAFSTNAKAATVESGTCGVDLEWTLDDQGTLTISGTGNMTNYASQGAPWFSIQNRKKLKKVIIEDGVTSIGNNAFAHLPAIIEIITPSTITKIGEDAFIYCESLQTFVIPEGVRTIPQFTFSNCTSLTTVVIPSSVRSFGDMAFNRCSSLEYIIIPEGVTTLPFCMFAGCSGLEYVGIPSTVTRIHPCVFDDCGNLWDVYYAGTSSQYRSITIDSYGNEQLNNATIYYSSKAPCRTHAYGGYTEVNDTQHSRTCGNCGYIETAQHTYDNACDTTCNACTFTRTTSHGYKTVTTKATLTNGGTIENKCSACGDVTSVTTIARPTIFTLSTVNYTYNGAVKKPAVTVKDANGKTLVNGTDYTVTYPSGRVNPGSYTVTVTMKGNYSGAKKLTFNIKLATPTVKASNATNGVKITWNKVVGAANYRVYKSVYSGGKWSGWVAIKSGVTGTTCTDNSVKSNDNVRYIVRAFNGNNSSAYKASNSIKFLATPTVKVANAANGVKIAWNKVAGAKSYIVYRSVYSGGKWSGWTRVKTGVTGTSYTDTTVKSGATVRYAVKAINGNFTSYIKASSTTKFLAQPTVKVAKATNGIKAAWGKSAGATGYIVYRRTYSGGKWGGWAAIKTTTALSYTDITAKKGVTYQYTVRAYSGSYKSSFTPSASIKR